MVSKNKKKEIKELKKLYRKVKTETREEIKEICLKEADIRTDKVTRREIKFHIKEELRFHKAFFKENLQLLKEER